MRRGGIRHRNMTREREREREKRRERENTEMTKKMKLRKCRRIQEEPKMIGEEQREIVRERMKMTSENGERDG